MKTKIFLSVVFLFIFFSNAFSFDDPHRFVKIKSYKMTVTYKEYYSKDGITKSYETKINGIIHNSLNEGENLEYLPDEAAKQYPSVMFYGNNLTADLKYNYVNPSQNINCNIMESNLPAEGSLYITVDTNEAVNIQKSMTEPWKNYDPNNPMIIPDINYQPPTLKYFSFKSSSLGLSQEQCEGNRVAAGFSISEILEANDLLLPQSSNSFTGVKQKNVENGYIKIEWEFSAM